MSDWRVIHGDAINMLRSLEPGSVDCVLTDPPYGMAYQSARRSDKAMRFDEIAGDDAPYVWFLPDAARCLKDGGCLLCFCRWDSAEAFRIAIEWAGLRIVSQIVWDRVVHGMGDLNGCPAPRHDTIWLAAKGKYLLPGKRPMSVVGHQRLSGDELRHPNEKPESLMVDLVESYCPASATIVDPFTGSGTTGVAAIRTGRNFIGSEIDKRYHDLACARMESEAAQGKLFGATA